MFTGDHLTRFGGVFLLHRFFQWLRLRRHFHRDVHFPQRNNFLFFSMRRMQQKMAGVVGSTLCILVVTLGLSVLLLPRMGLLGAGLAWLAAQSLTATVIMVRYARAVSFGRSGGADALTARRGDGYTWPVGCTLSPDPPSQ